MTNIRVEIVKPEDLNTEQINRMYTIMCKYYDNMIKKVFQKDLEEKNAIFLLLDADCEIQGFTSVVIHEKEIREKKIGGVFSGDTIVEKEYRGSFDLPFAWLQYVYKQKTKYDKMFWFMLSKGYRTYRLLPRFFKEHYPTYKKETPKEVGDILNTFAVDMFGEKYNKKTNIFVPDYNYFLKSGKEEIRPELLKDPHIKFFKDRNPGFWKGDELVNYADLDTDNLTLYGTLFVKSGDNVFIRFLVVLAKKISKLKK